MRSAVYKAANIINAIESEFIARSCARKHPLLGPASLNVAAVLGYSNSEAVTALRRAPGDKPAGAVVPDICTIYLDRRRIPGETLEEVFADFERLIAEMSARDPDLSAKIGYTPACPELPYASAARYRSTACTGPGMRAHLRQRCRHRL